MSRLFLHSDQSSANVHAVGNTPKDAPQKEAPVDTPSTTLSRLQQLEEEEKVIEEEEEEEEAEEADAEAKAEEGAVEMDLMELHANDGAKKANDGTTGAKDPYGDELASEKKTLHDSSISSAGQSLTKDDNPQKAGHSHNSLSNGGLNEESQETGEEERSEEKTRADLLGNGDELAGKNGEEVGQEERQLGGLGTPGGSVKESEEAGADLSVGANAKEEEEEEEESEWEKEEEEAAEKEGDLLRGKQAAVESEDPPKGEANEVSTLSDPDARAKAITSLKERLRLRPSATEPKPDAAVVRVEAADTQQLEIVDEDSESSLETWHIALVLIVLGVAGTLMFRRKLRQSFGKTDSKYARRAVR